ncbi:MAG: NAD(P)H-quinone oxidoreductase, partial [Myxococcota bacterium]
VGERICGLVGGGGYAELCVAPEDQCLPIPAGVTPIEAGAIPETWFTVWANVFEHGALQPGETLLVHGGSSGIGHVALQLAVARGARVITTSSQPDKRAFCERLGAELTVDYREEDFVARVLEHTEGRGADVVLDMVGGDYLPRNLEALAFRGRIVSIATLRGATAELPILKLMAKQAILTGSFLRRRSRAEKARLRQRVEDELWPLLAKGRVRPHVDRSFPLAAAADAHRVMEAGSFLGKLVLVP